MLDVVGEGVQAFWQDDMLLDYTIEVQDECIKVHKVIMAAASDYFKVMLTGDMVESQTDRVRLEGQNAQAVSAMVEFIYTGQFGTTEVSTEELLACAMYLQIQPAIEICCQRLCDEVNAKNCIDVLETFQAYNMEDGIEQTVRHIRSNMDEILNGFDMDTTSLDKFKILLDSWGQSEWKLFVAIKEWVKFDSQNRMQHLNDLMSRVRFALMTPEQLEVIKDMDIYSMDSPWCYLVADAKEYHNLPIQCKILDESEQSKVRADPTPVGFEESEDGFFHALKGTTWIRDKAIDQPQSSFGGALIEVNNFLIVCNRKEFNVFDPRTKRWSFLTTLPVRKIRFHPIYCDEILYVFGGETRQYGQAYAATDSIEQYDFDDSTWSVNSSKMPVVLEDFSACVLDHLIYVIGGYESTPEDNGRHGIRMDCFDPSTNTWSRKAPMTDCVTEYEIEVIELWKEKVIAIITHGFCMRYYSPSTDQWSAYDPLVATTTRMVYHHIGSVFSSGNRLFLINFPYTEYECVSGNVRMDILDTAFGACEVWIMRGKGKKPIVKKVDDFPVQDQEELTTNIFITSLALAPH